MTLKQAKEILRAVAAKKGVGVGEVRKNIQKAIDLGMANPDPQIKNFWESVPHRGARPSPEEVIRFLGKRLALSSDIEQRNLWS